MAAVEHEVVRRRAEEHTRVTQDELRAELERRTLRELGVTADEFIARLAAGEIDADAPAVADLAFLARVLQRAEQPRFAVARGRFLTRCLQLFR
jgi:hypothetical protein